MCTDIWTTMHLSRALNITLHLWATTPMATVNLQEVNRMDVNPGCKCLS